MMGPNMGKYRPLLRFAETRARIYPQTNLWQFLDLVLKNYRVLLLICGRLSTKMTMTTFVLMWCPCTTYLSKTVWRQAETKKRASSMCFQEKNSLIFIEIKHALSFHIACKQVAYEQLTKKEYKKLQRIIIMNEEITIPMHEFPYFSLAKFARCDRILFSRLI